MVLSPADSGPASRGGSGRGDGDPWLAAPLAESSPFAGFSGVPAQAPRLACGQQVAAGALNPGAALPAMAMPSIAEAGVRQGGCFVRPLPLDATCAGVARSFFREAVAGSGLPVELVHDGLTMASELAANTLNAHRNVEFAGGGRRPVSGMPEFWLYIRNCGDSDPGGRELVCKVFDSEPGWWAGQPSADANVTDAVDPYSVSGRGLQVVAGLSAGCWGHHRTRGRLGAWKVPGKAVWFALRVPPATEFARYQRPVLAPWQAADELAVLLGDRGLRGLVRTHERSGDMAVVSVRHRLTVWCHGHQMWWRAPDSRYARLGVTDLIEAAEQIVRDHEELSAASAAATGR
jgi:hypothetical protein